MFAILAAYGVQLAATSITDHAKDLEYFKQLTYVGLLLPSIWLGKQQLVLTELVETRNLKALARFQRESAKSQIYSLQVLLMVIYLTMSVLKIWFASYTMQGTQTSGQLQSVSGVLDIFVFLPSALQSLLLIAQMQSLAQQDLMLKEESEQTDEEKESLIRRQINKQWLERNTMETFMDRSHLMKSTEATDFGRRTVEVCRQPAEEPS